MAKINLKPTHKVISEYYKSLQTYGQLGLYNEGTVSPPFAILLESAAKQSKWALVQQYQKKVKGKNIRIDGAIVDQWGLPHGYWEAKDSKDDLKKEVKKKFAVGYPKDNIIFQEPGKAILIQNEKEVGEFNLLDAEELVRLLERFFDYEPPAFDEWIQAEAKFREQLPELGEALLRVIENAKVNNKAFQEAFATFYETCRTSINPNLSEKAVEEMLIQHILTERIFRTVFRNSEFTKRNVIAREIEQVILALTSQSFSREDFLSRFDHFYKALEHRADAVETFAEKQTFLNNVYERFFQGFAVKVADTHGIVYTPEPIVNFMVRSVEEILQKEFGKSLSDENVHILDPFVGTGNFIIHIIDAIKKTSLEHKYKNELHCNEVMLLPYYVASMNIEHGFYEKVGKYEPFEGICLVDTFDMAEHEQHSLGFMTEENTARIQRQKKSPITIVIGNPPYNARQVNENDNNKNRKYSVMDKRVADTYAADSTATNKNALADPYVKAFRWASDRIQEDGIVAYVTNNGFLNGIAFDGMRKNLKEDFSSIYHIDLKGNARMAGERRRKEGGNIFDDLIRVGIGLTFLVKRRNTSGCATIAINQINDYVSSRAKKNFLDDSGTLSKVELQNIIPDERHTWLTSGIADDFDNLLCVGNKETKNNDSIENAIFRSYSRGVESTRDDWVFNFDAERLGPNVAKLIDSYNDQVSKWHSVKRSKDHLDGFVESDSRKIKWSSSLKFALLAKRRLRFDNESVRSSQYHPFVSEKLYFDETLIHRRGQNYLFLPNPESENENVVIACNGVGSEKDFSPLISNKLVNLSYYGGGTALQCFPFFTYHEDGTNRRENITDWALEQFRENYKDTSITKWDIFHYTYAILHHPEYREKYAANLKRELPRIPFAPDFWGFAKAGKELADIHVNYEDQPEYKLDMIENGKLALDWCVEKMRYNKEKTAIIYNDFLTVAGIPPEVHEYRLGNRSALDWIVDQYKVSTDKRSGITNDPNRDDDPQYIVRLIKKIVTVSLRTNEIVNSLSALSEA